MSAMSDEDKRRRLDAMYEKAKRSFPEVADVTVEELRSLQDQGKVVIVDVRSPAEQAVSMISGAITAEQFEADRSACAGATIVAYCTIGGRSGVYAHGLQAEGWKVFNLRGAILAWTHGGGELVSAGGPTKKVHVHNRKFALTADGYEDVW